MIFLSIGSNLNSQFGNRFENINKSLLLLKNENIKILKISSFYETPSYPNNSNPKFINIAIKIKFEFSVLNLLNIIARVEKAMGRERKAKNNPRTCDIDIIDFNGLIENSVSINLPHPRICERNFVLYPLFEIQPNWVHPKNNKKIDILIENLEIKTRNEITRVKESGILVQ
jgi:2-amino-4-hydroxy-6-hydroxymethyldihydropteridine diphosphokinase|tara:strand:- start:18 stop:533 length:516 start_codon:yes stop_codon:yes gene_type:complete